MKKIFAYIAGALLLVSCTKDMTNLNTDTKRPIDGPPESFYTYAQKNLMDGITNSNVNRGIFRLLSQYWTETTYIDESQYDLNKRSIPANFWNILYRDVLQNLKESKKLNAKQDPLFVPAAQIKNQQALIQILEVYTYSVLITVYGDIPYTQALDIETPSPAYDDDKAVYDNLIVKLDQALTDLDESAEGFPAADLIYGGDIAAWKKFGNSLKLRLGLLLVDTDLAKATTIITQASSGAFSSASDDAIFHYTTTPPNTNPIWVDLVQSGRKDFIAANTIIDKMKALQDPRIQLYFGLDRDGLYTGGIYGTKNSYTRYSKPAAAILAPDFSAVLLDYTEVEFLRAEAAARGIAITGTAEEHYNNGIKASILSWGGTEAQYNTYVALAAVKYDAAKYKELIGTQSWIAYYNRGYEGWLQWRRTDFPVLNPPPGFTYADIPLRFTYPIDEQNLNKANYDKAASAIGGDLKSTKLFWDK